VAVGIDEIADQPGIGTLNEKALHAGLKAWYQCDRDAVEVNIDNYVVDIVRGDLLVEIQTQNFSSIKNKLLHLTDRHPVRLVYPVAQKKWIIKTSRPQGETQSRRKSPKRGSPVDVFTELVSFPNLVSHHNFTLQVLMTMEEEVRRFDGSRAWRRRGWVIHERRLLDVVEEYLFESPRDFLDLLPDSLTEPFSTSELSLAIGRPRRLAQKMAYCLRKMGSIKPVGKRRNAKLYIRAPI
jgi:hypothetical protein